MKLLFYKGRYELNNIYIYIYNIYRERRDERGEMREGEKERERESERGGGDVI